MFYVYKYYIKDELVYIGKTLVGPYERYRQHILEDSKYNQITYFEVMTVNSEIDMDILESYLIAKHKPVWNIKDTDKGDLGIDISYNYQFEGYGYSEFVRVFGFGKTRSPISRNRLKEISGRDIIKEFKPSHLVFDAKYRGHNRGYEVHIPEWFLSCLRDEFDKRENAVYGEKFPVQVDIPITDFGTDVINYRVDVENVNTGIKESVYIVDHVFWKGDVLYAHIEDLEDYINKVNSV